MKHLKRVLATFLCVLLCLTWLTGALPSSAVTAGVPKIALSEAIAEPGEEVEITVQMSENPGLMVILLDIAYNHDLLTLTGTEDAGLTGWDRNEDHVLWLGEADSSFNGTILKLRFRVADTAGAGDIPVTLECRTGDVGNHNEEAFLPAFTAGRIHIHGWADPTYVWTADNSQVTATRVCTLDAEHVETETVNTTNAVSHTPNCTEKGETTYTATFANPAFTTQTRTLANIPALGHDYQPAVTAPTCTENGFTTYTCSRCGDSYTADEVLALGHNYELTGWTWTGYTAATATFTCKNDASHVQTVDAEISVVRTEPTATENGSAVYTATVVFEGDTYTDVRTEILPKTEHDYELTGWSWTGYTAATASFRDKNGGEDLVLDAVITEARTEPTCETAGEVVYTATVSLDGQEYTDQKTEELPALDHDWGTPTYVWSEDLSSCTATAVCQRDGSHVLTETAETSAEITLQPTGRADGETTFTAVFTKEPFQTQTATRPIDKLVNPFIDVRERDYFFDPVIWAVYHDPLVTNGTSATTFSPNDTCTRAQVVTFLWRTKGCPEPTMNQSPFKDVAKPGEYYYKAVLWAVENGITTGTSATTFSPNEGCTRGQVVTFLWRTEGKPAPQSTENPFKDVKAGEYYYSAVLWAVENGVTTGTDPGKFSPSDTCTRGQIVTFLYRAFAA